MGATIPHELGRNQRFYARREVTPFTFLRPNTNGDAAGSPAKTSNALRVLKSMMKRTQERKTRADARQTRSILERITGKVNVTWSLECYALPSGVAGTPPDMHELLAHHFGSYANVPATSDTYTPADSQTALGALSLVREMNSIGMQAIRGGMCNTWKLALSGGDEPKMTFEGEGVDLVGTGYGTANGTVNASDTVIPVAAADVDNYRVGSVIAVGTSNNSAGSPPGHLVTAKAGTNLTITPAIIGSQGVNPIITPYVPTEVVTGSPIAGILGSLNFDATARASLSPVPVVSCAIERSNGLKYFKDEAFQANVTDYVPGFTETKVEFTIRARRDYIIWLNAYESVLTTQYPMVMTCGNAAGRRLVTTINRFEMDEVELDVPEAEEALIKISGKAIANAGADEFSLAFT